MRTKKKNKILSDLEVFILEKGDLGCIEVGNPKDFNLVCNALCRYDGRKGVQILYLEKGIGKGYGTYHYRLYRQQ